MNDENFNPPQPPTPEPKKGITINPKYAIAFAVAAFALLMLVILAPSDNKSTPVTTDAPAPVITASPAPAVNKYDAYLDHVYNNSGQANTMTKAKLIEYGDIICNALDTGRTIPWITNYLSENSSGQSDIELYASIIYGSITYICDEYKGDLNLYLNS
jgi:hypothetical protein